MQTALDELCEVEFHEAGTELRARILARFADSEVFVPLTAEPSDDQAELMQFPTDAGQIAVAFDDEDRLQSFIGAAVPFLAMPGRVLAELLANETTDLLVNPGFPSQMQLDQTILTWLVGALSGEPVEDNARLRLAPPDKATIADLAEALAERLADMRAVISDAALLGVRQEGEAKLTSHVLQLRGVAPERERDIAKAFADLLALLPAQAGGVDIGFIEKDFPDFALRFDMTLPERENSKKDAPPKLRW